MTIIFNAPASNHVGSFAFPPAGWVVPSGLDYLLFQVDIPMPDYEDPAKGFTLEIGILNGSTFEPGLGGISRSGGSHFVGKDGTVNPPPTKKVLMRPDLIGKKLQLRLTIPTLMQIGGTIRTEP